MNKFLLLVFLLALVLFSGCDDMLNSNTNTSNSVVTIEPTNIATVIPENPKPTNTKVLVATKTIEVIEHFCIIVDLDSGNTFVYLRSGAGKRFSVISISKEGDRLKMLGVEENGWYKIEYNNGIAWVYSEYCK